jgi:iron complex outermembrane receptor protein
MCKSSRGLFGAIAVPLALAAPLSSSAQPAEDHAKDEIIVTAQFRAQRLQDTPIAITAVTDDMLRARGQDSLFQITATTPNVQMEPGALAFGPALNVYIRGVGQDDFLPNVEPGVGMYIDDVYYSTLTATNWDLVDLERVEILRGPQGTLQGRNSVGGAVRVITRRPTGDGGGFAEVGVGDFDSVGLKGAGDFAIVPENLFLRVSGVTEQRDGYIDRLDFACANPAQAAAVGIPNLNQGKPDCKLGTLGGKSVAAGRMALRWVPSDRVEFNLAVDRTNDNSEAPALTIMEAVQSVDAQYGPWFVTGERPITYENFIDPAGGGSGAGPILFTPINEFIDQGLSLVIDYQISDTLSLKSISAWRDLSSEFGSSTDGAPTAYGEFAYNLLTQESFQQELRLNGSSGSVDWTAGLFWFDRDVLNNGRIDIRYLPFLPVGSAFDFISRQTIDGESLALFAHAVWNLSDDLHLTAGLRWSDEEKSQTETRLDSFTLQPSTNPAFGDFLANGGSLTRTFADDRVDYRLALDYRVSDNFMTYGSVSTGFKNGGANARPFFGSQFVTFDVETVLAYEWGYKTDLLDNRLRLNGAVFFNEYEDMQLVPLTCDDISPFPNAPCAAPRNLADADIKGTELELTWYPSNEFAIDVAAAYISMDIKRVDPAAIGPIDPSLDTPENTPRYKYNAGFQYDFELANGGSVTPRVDYIYTHERTGLGTSDYVLDSYDVVNASLTWRGADRDWEAAFVVTNLTDEWYLHNSFDLTGAGAAWLAAHPAPPRMWSMRLRHFW